LLTVTQGRFYSIDSNGSAYAHAAEVEWATSKNNFLW
jgi:hypothetical protein